MCHDKDPVPIVTPPEAGAAPFLTSDWFCLTLLTLHRSTHCAVCTYLCQQNAFKVHPYFEVSVIYLYGYFLVRFNYLKYRVREVFHPLCYPLSGCSNQGPG